MKAWRTAPQSASSAGPLTVHAEGLVQWRLGAQPQSILLQLLLLLVILPFPFTFAQSDSFSPSFSPGESKKFWVSAASGNFTFGFKALPQPGQFLLAIWHSNDSVQTPIWWAADGTGPAIATQESAFLYNESAGILQLQMSSVSKVQWRSSSNSSSNSSVQFVDTGNLRVAHDNFSVWESFQDQRNSLMLMSLTPSLLINKPKLLQSIQNQTSFADGQFHMATYQSFQIHLFGIDELHHQYVYMKDYNVSVNISGPGGLISIGNQLDGTAYISGDPQLEKITLDYDGNLRVYRWYQSNQTWVAVWALLQDWSLHCRAANPCGSFGICRIDQTATTFSCSCPIGYSPVSSTDMSKGCNTSRSPPSCGTADGQLTVMEEEQDADFYYNDLTWVTGVYQIEECKSLCLNNCLCIAATFSGSTCFLKGNSSMGYLVNGISNGDSPTLLMKLLQLPAVPSPRKARHLRPIVIVLALVAALMIVCFVLAGAAFRRKRHDRSPHIDLWDADPSKKPIRFSYQQLVEVTDNFSHPLGEGGYGSVYKGCVKDPSGSHDLQVAVKVLKQIPSDKLLQAAEISTLSKIHHLNLVQLHGYCIGGRKGEKILLVFEFMENGDLDRYLSPKHRQQPLPWPTRFAIAVGTARGVAYLHHECNPPILHCDIKPQNVLLDKSFKPKVADFGLAASFCNSAQSHVSLQEVRGTRGYIAPEWINGKPITAKADVYSFGMVLLQIVHGLNTIGDDNMSLIEWAHESIAAGVVLQTYLHESVPADDYAEAPAENTNFETETANLRSPLPAENTNSETETVNLQFHLPLHIAEKDEEEATAQQQQLRLIRLALWCVLDRPVQRPSMSDMVRLMEGNQQVLDPPNPFAANSECELDARQIACYYDTTTSGEPSLSPAPTCLHYQNSV